MSKKFTQAEISREVGRSRERIRQILLEEGIDDLPRRQRYCPSCGEVLPKYLALERCFACAKKRKEERRKKTWSTYFCLVCDNPIERLVSSQKRSKKVFCNKSCQGKWLGREFGFKNYPENRWKGGAPVVTYEVIDASEIPPRGIQRREAEKLLEVVLGLEPGKAILVTCGSKGKAESLRRMIVSRLANKGLECRSIARKHEGRVELFLWAIHKTLGELEKEMKK